MIESVWVRWRLLRSFYRTFRRFGHGRMGAARSAVVATMRGPRQLDALRAAAKRRAAAEVEHAA